jgi:periplasmic copper chaperone A
MKKFFLVCILMSPIIAWASSADDLTIQDAYVRASVPDNPNTAAYFVIKNSSTIRHALTGVKTPVAKAELHESIQENGVFKMQHQKNIIIQAESMITLKPGGLHIMLMGLKQPLKLGESVELQLTFEDGSQRVVDIPVT